MTPIRTFVKQTVGECDHGHTYTVEILTYPQSSKNNHAYATVTAATACPWCHGCTVRTALPAFDTPGRFTSDAGSDACTT